MSGARDADGMVADMAARKRTDTASTVRFPTALVRRAIKVAGHLTAKTGKIHSISEVLGDAAERGLEAAGFGADWSAS